MRICKNCSCCYLGGGAGGCRGTCNSTRSPILLACTFIDPNRSITGDTGSSGRKQPSLWMSIEPSKSLGPETSFTLVLRWAAQSQGDEGSCLIPSEAEAGTKLRWLLRLPQQMILSHLKCFFQLMYVANSLALVLLYSLLQIQLQTLFSCCSWNCSQPNIMFVRVLFCSPCSPRCPCSKLQHLLRLTALLPLHGTLLVL